MAKEKENSTNNKTFLLRGEEEEIIFLVLECFYTKDQFNTLFIEMKSG